MKRMCALALALASIFVLAACGSSDNGSKPAAAGPSTTSGGEHGHQAVGESCEPAGTSLEIVAKNVKFDKKCLAAPAEQAFTLTLDNKDNGIPHNVAIFRNADMSDRLFTGKTFPGDEKMTYEVKALPPGEYHFHCDAHPDLMEGIFVVR